MGAASEFREGVHERVDAVGRLRVTRGVPRGHLVFKRREGADVRHAAVVYDDARGEELGLVFYREVKDRNRAPSPNAYDSNTSCCRRARRIETPSRETRRRRRTRRKTGASWREFPNGRERSERVRR